MKPHVKKWGSREINKPDYSKHDDDDGDAEAKNVPYIMSCYTLSGLPRRHDGTYLWTVRKAHDRLLE